MLIGTDPDVDQTSHRPHVVIVHQGEDLPSDEGYAPLRYGRLAAALTSQGVSVTRVSPSFRHSARAQRSLDLVSGPTEEGRVHLVPTSGFDGSVSAGRARFIADFARGAGSFLAANQDNIDVILVGVPPPGCIAAARRAVGTGVPIVADIRDVWPDCLAVGDRTKWEPGLKMIGRALSQELRLADTVLAVSDPMLEWSPERPAMDTIPIGMRASDLSKHRPPSAGSPLRACFISNHTAGFDFVPVLEGWQRFTEGAGNGQPELVFIGAEPEDPTVRSIADRSPTIAFGGRVAADEVESLLSTFDLGLAPTTPRFGDSLSNKVFDYLAAGLHLSHSIDPAVSREIDRLGLGTHVPLVADAWAAHFAEQHDTRDLMRCGRAQRVETAQEAFGANATTARLVDVLLGRVTTAV